MPTSTRGRKGCPSAAYQDEPTEPFATAADAWFWYMACHQASVDGARVVAGLARVCRPCEPGDIHRLVTKLYRARRLRSDHLRALIRYGRMMLPPDPGRSNGYRDLRHWHEALAQLEQAFRAKGIVR
jgi:hypothetical protein